MKLVKVGFEMVEMIIRIVKGLSVVFLGLSFVSCTVGGGPPAPPLFGPNPLWDTLRFLSPFFDLVIILLLIGGGIYFFSGKHPFGRRSSRYSAKDIAQMRYANGEISREEYLRIIKDIEASEGKKIEEEDNE